MFRQKENLKNFAIFTGKHLCQNLCFIKFQAEACNFIMKENLAQAFSCEFCDLFLQNKSFFYRKPLGGCFWILTKFRCIIGTFLPDIVNEDIMYLNSSRMSSSKWRVAVRGELIILESYGSSDVTTTVTLFL